MPYRQVSFDARRLLHTGGLIGIRSPHRESHLSHIDGMFPAAPAIPSPGQRPQGALDLDNGPARKREDRARQQLHRVQEPRLAELLWPESDGDMAHHSFIVALSRLRKLLGKEEALVLKEGRLSLSNRHCWVDVWAFERFLRQAEKARKEASCRRTLSSVLGVDPSAETRAIAASLGRS